MANPFMKDLWVTIKIHIPIIHEPDGDLFYPQPDGSPYPFTTTPDWVLNLSSKPPSETFPQTLLETIPLQPPPFRHLPSITTTLQPTLTTSDPQIFTVPITFAIGPAIPPNKVLRLQSLENRPHNHYRTRIHHIPCHHHRILTPRSRN